MRRKSNQIGYINTTATSIKYSKGCHSSFKFWKISLPSCILQCHCVARWEKHKHNLHHSSKLELYWKKRQSSITTSERTSAISSSYVLCYSQRGDWSKFCQSIRLYNSAFTSTGGEFHYPLIRRHLGHMIFVWMDQNYHKIVTLLPEDDTENEVGHNFQQSWRNDFCLRRWWDGKEIYVENTQNDKCMKEDLF